MHVLTQDGILWRTLPCPIPPAQRHKLQGVRLAGPQRLSAAALVIQRKVSSRGGIQVARQRIHVGMTHAGKIVTIELGDTSLRVIDEHGELISTVPATAVARSAGSRPTETGNRHERPHDKQARYPEGGDLLTGVTLDVNDAAELAEMLQFISGGLACDRGRLSA